MKIDLSKLVSAAEKAHQAYDELLKQFTVAVQIHMDAEAKTRNYDSILSLCTYATSKSERFSKEGQAGVDFRDACWTYGYAELEKVAKGTRPQPTIEQFIAELPKMEWPQ